MSAYEKLGLFYLGRQVDLATGRRQQEPLLYKSKDLVTHAVCLGMTGSGKTGLGIGLIEEAAIDGIPVIAIDPKGDLANLLLTFPELRPEDFEPWVDPADAAARGMTVETLARQHADSWIKGLAEWDQDGARIARLRAAAGVDVYTPGSRAGIPLALLGSLRAPASEDEEDAADRVASTAASLLSLAGYGDAAPHSREHAFVSAILSQATPEDQPTDLPWLVREIQRPAFDRIGVLDLETFYPARDRQELALRFNSVLASPGFDVWLSGVPLDPGSMLFDAQGRPRVAIVSIAHLGESERMLVVSLLLNAILRWTRQQTGTGSLRALVYMDEVFGYLPPVANPPSKRPLLTLLKQARAYGVGVVLATQNPVDLDYKALSNTGTWFLGTLQTERDKARVLDGLEGVASGLDRATLDTALSALRSRVFLMHNVHDSVSRAFETRWTLSYLRGPMTREELRRATATSTRAVASAALAASESPQPAPAASRSSAAARPIVPAGVRELFFPLTPGTTDVVPVLYGAATLHFTDARRQLDVVRDVVAVTAFCPGAIPIDWNAADVTSVTPDQLSPALDADASISFAQLPPSALDAKRYAAWTQDFSQWVMRSQRLTLFTAQSYKLTSAPGESERDFRIRVRQAAREAKDEAVEKLRARYASKVARLTQRVQSARDAIARETQQAQQQRTQTAVSFGATVLGALFGGRALSMSTLGRATTTVRGVGRTVKESQDVSAAQEKVVRAESELTALHNELAEEVAALSASGADDETIETLEIAPKRGGVDVALVALVWKARP